MIKSTEKFNFSEPILNSSKLGLIRLSVYNSVFNVNRRNNQFLYDTQGKTMLDTRILAVIPGAYELIEISELIKEETNGNVIREPDKNLMKCLMEIKQGANKFEIENSIDPLLGFKKFMNKVSVHLKRFLILWVLVLLTTIVMLFLVLNIMVITQTYYIILL